MKKVGIITYHHYYNYGTALQAYALQKAIDGIDGYRAEIIDYRAHDENKLSTWQMLWLRLRRMPFYMVELNRVITLKKYAPVLNEKHPAFNSFFSDDFVTSSKTFHNIIELRREAPNYDIMVTGSDQTWSPKIGFKPAMFLEFGSSKPMHIAYAPSIGVSNLSRVEAGFINVHLQPYEAISCRERIGTEVLQNSVKGKKIVNVLDPTLLLNKDDWDRIAERPTVNDNYILCYFIGNKSYYRKIAQQLSKDMDLPLYFIPVSWMDMGKGYNLLPKAGPKEFLGLIRDARLVLTDSFHGTAFAINYRKSFYSFTKIEGGKNALDNSRLYDILSKLHLESRLYDQPGTIEFSDVDYTEADKILSEERVKSWEYLKDALDDKRICSHEECTACMACEAVCQHDAISIVQDLMGFHYPKKDMERCLNCGLCSKVCPNNTLPKYHRATEAYVATAIDHVERQTSASGGIASVLARYIICKGGVVYGCSATDATHVRHVRIDKEEELTLLKGSKYVQSDMQGVMTNVKNDLKKGQKVLFVGTPCQVAGLKNFLGKDYPNLWTVDFVCHGVPSQKLLSDIVGREYRPLDGKRIDFRFKDDNGHSNYGVLLTDKEGNCVYKEIYPQSRYQAGFLGGVYYRDSCYQCHYARGERVSDITLGDYWDREKSYTEVGTEGLSLMMVNTEHGKEIVEAVGKQVVKKSITVETLQTRNAQLRKPMPRHKFYDEFRYEYMNFGYSEKALKLLDKEIVRRQRSRTIGNAISIIKQNMIGRKIINIIKSMRKTMKPDKMTGEGGG